MRKVEISIENQGLEYRRMFTKINKSISDKQKELTSITTPEIERLKKIEEEAKEKQILAEREARMPERTSRLDAINPKRKIVYTKSELLGMDSVAFEKFYNSCVAKDLQITKDELDKKAKEEEEENTKKLVEQQSEIDKKQKEFDRIRLEHENKIAEERKAIEKEKEEIRLQQEQKNAEEKARVEEIRLAESRRAYHEFRVSKGWTEETKKDFDTRSIDGGYELWHKVGTFIIK